MKKINRKGFTLIELIAVIVILSIILIVAVPNLIETYKQSKLKSEGMFVKQLTKSNTPYLIRIPIIPSFNETLEDAEGFAKLLKKYNVKAMQKSCFHYRFAHNQKQGKNNGFMPNSRKNTWFYAFMNASISVYNPF